MEGSWADRIVGLDGVRSDLAMMGTPDGSARVELIEDPEGIIVELAERLG